MRKYSNRPMGALASDLVAGLARLRKGYIDSAENLLSVIDPAGEYPFEFVLFRLTAYRPSREAPPTEPMDGKSLRDDLMAIILDVCDSFGLSVNDYDEAIYDTEQLASRFSVSTKTIGRWRRRGLPARRLIFADGKRRVAFLESSVQHFVKSRPEQIRRSVSFRQMTDAERADIIRRARRMANLSSCSLNEVAKRLATKTGRAVETIRYTIRKYDNEYPDRAIFPDMSSPLEDDRKAIIYDSFLHGETVSRLARKYKRTRGSIYRVINEMRAQQLHLRKIAFMYNAQFDLPNADQIILVDQPEPKPGARAAKTVKAPPDLPAYLKSLYEVPLLTIHLERWLFRKYNYLKYKAEKLRQQIDMTHIRTSQLKKIETLLVQANIVKNQIVRSNLRLVVSIAKKHLGGPQTLFELISDGNVSLMQAVEKFDYALGNRFSTYGSWAIIRNFARSVSKERYQLDRFSTSFESVLDIAASLRTYDPNEFNISELRESIDSVLIQLSPRERTILIDHYGLDEHGQVKTFEQLGKRLGLSKERVRQIEVHALQKLRQIMHTSKADLLG